MYGLRRAVAIALTAAPVLASAVWKITDFTLSGEDVTNTVIQFPVTGFVGSAQVNTSLTFSVQVNSFKQPFGYGNVAINGQRLSQESMNRGSKGEGLITAGSQVVDAAWIFRSFSFVDDEPSNSQVQPPSAQILQFNIRAIDGKAVEQSFWVQFEQHPTAKILFAPTWVEEKTRIEEAAEDVRNELAQLEQLKIRVLELEYEIYRKEEEMLHYIPEDDLNQCDVVACVLKGLVHKTCLGTHKLMRTAYLKMTGRHNKDSTAGLLEKLHWPRPHWRIPLLHKPGNHSHGHGTCPPRGGGDQPHSHQHPPFIWSSFRSNAPMVSPSPERYHRSTGPLHRRPPPAVYSTLLYTERFHCKPPPEGHPARSPGESYCQFSQPPRPTFNPSAGPPRYSSPGKPGKLPGNRPHPPHPGDDKPSLEDYESVLVASELRSHPNLPRPDIHKSTLEDDDRVLIGSEIPAHLKPKSSHPHSDHKNQTVTRIMLVIKVLVVCKLSVLAIAAIWRYCSQTGRQARRARREERQRRRAFRHAAKRQSIRNWIMQHVYRGRRQEEMSDEEKEALLVPLTVESGSDIVGSEIGELRNAVSIVSDIISAEEGRVSTKSRSSLPDYMSQVVGGEGLPVYNDETRSVSDVSSLTADGFMYTPGSTEYSPSNSEAENLGSVLGDPKE